ncbi:MAG: hypothetical protein Q3965_05035 [Rothia sp. (in: high G+C Gram-positive bacteria)]|nr:hypothetical protein [Rothia sp. (in: high G+C Gram-positive bacteria)]
MPAHVFLEGSVYSPIDPFATALLINDGKVEWVGQDAGARSIADSTMEVTELQGQLLAPTFTLAAVQASTAEQAHGVLCAARDAGYGEVNLFTATSVLPDLSYELGVAPVLFVEAAALDRGEASTNDCQGVFFTEDDLALLPLLPVAADRRLTASGVFSSQTAQEKFLEAVEQLSPLDRMRISPRLDGIGHISDQIVERAKSLSVTLGFVSDIGAAGQNLARALAAGAAVTLGSDPLGEPAVLGWDLVSTAVQAPEDQAISARAAFQAMTRGVQRANGAANPMAGQLAPGSQANFSIWQVTELMVQTPDSRISAWSTDPRARTPLLPALAEDLERPVLTALYVGGVAIKK